MDDLFAWLDETDAVLHIPVEPLNTEALEDLHTKLQVSQIAQFLYILIAT